MIGDRRRGQAAASLTTTVTMSATLRAVPSSTSRGEVNIQPAYFTSSLFVDPFREDIEFLTQCYKVGYEHGKSSPSFQPFTLFKNIWSTYGWNLLHLKILEPRGRDVYTSVVSRLFLGTWSVSFTRYGCSNKCLRRTSRVRSNPPRPRCRSFRLLHILDIAAFQFLSADTKCCAHSHPAGLSYSFLLVAFH